MITKAALLLFRDGNAGKELLFVRASNKPFFVFPGGKQEDGEKIAAALQRELQEELGTQAKDVRILGVVTGQTPDGRDLEMHVYTGHLQGEPSPHSEIEEFAWMTKRDIADRLGEMTPMTIDHVLPFLAARGIW